MSTVPSYETTALVGGQDGTLFNDIYVFKGDGNFLVSDAAKNQIDTAHPITEIIVYHGWIIDGFQVTYQLANGGTTTIQHGSGADPRRTTSQVTFGANEVLVGVFGRAGFQTYYRRDMINELNFAIYDKATGTLRVAGPFGNGNNSNQGTLFYSSDVMAFGGFAQDTPDLGLSGLFFVKSEN
ncbi:hypothetical protein C8Q76DRAFT_803399 [Earliella scabrosa]|nr:hypothetical protein C8Q76DRAFT_803399 [Earliella scabrosa]